MFRHCLAIVNPAGGLHRGGHAAKQLRQALQEAGISLDVQMTEHPQHAEQLARTLDLQPYDCLCVVGGDGTVHDVVGGLLAREAKLELPIALIPAGTGNTLHHDLGCETVERAACSILEGKTRWLDVVEVESQGQVIHCVNIVGWGAIADINRRAESFRFLGSRRYHVAALCQMLSPKIRRAKLTIDGETIEDDFQFVIACVTRTTGTGMMLAPQAKIDDGKVDLVFVRGASRWQLLEMFRRVQEGTHLQLPFVEFRQAQRFAIDSEPTPLNLDGENVASTPFQARVEPSVLQVLCLDEHADRP